LFGFLIVFCIGFILVLLSQPASLWANSSMV
jgi:hypothetical protein